ncbi:unnamed protein product, partial [Polarella glacialis]
DVVLRSLLWLSSPEAFRASLVCRALRVSLSSPCLLELGSRLCHDEQSSASAAWGLQSSGSVWLHALLEALEIASYMEQAKLFEVLGELRFRDQGEIRALGDAMRSLRLGESSASSLFAAACAFSPDEVSSLLYGCDGAGASSEQSQPQMVRSQPFCLSWRPNLGQSGEVRLHVRLKLGPARGPEVADGEGSPGRLLRRVGGNRLKLSIEAGFMGDLLTEELDCLELDVFGGCLVPEDDSSWRLQPIQPHRGVAAVGSAVAPFGDEGTVLLTDTLLQMLLQGLPVVIAR